jgi:hypothetical protein
MLQNRTRQIDDSESRCKATQATLFDICIGLLFLIMVLRALLDQPYRD